MKNNSLLLMTLITTTFLLSCSRTGQTVVSSGLEHAESIMYQYPDSILKVLEQMRMPESSNKSDHATWCLLLAQAKYKNYIKQSDSLINIAYTYFMEQDDPQRKALVLYLEGAINQELGEIEKATQFYLKAADEITKTTDHQLGHLIYVGLGNIYMYRDVYKYAQNAFEKSYTYAESSANEDYKTNSLTLLARLYFNQEEWDKSLKYYKDALDLSNSNADERGSGRIMLEMSEIYYNKKEYLKALEYTQKEFRLINEDNPDYSKACLIIGKIYFNMNNADSAYHYLNKVLESDGLHNKRGAYETLFYLSYDKKRYAEMTDYFHSLQTYTDSIQKIDRTNSIVEIQEKYDKEKLLNEKNQLKIKQNLTLRIALLMLIFLLCVITVIVYCYQRRLLQKGRTIQENEEQIRLYTLKVHENEVLINYNDSRIHELSVEMEQNLEIQELLEEQKNVIVEIQNQNEKLCEENETLQDKIRHYTSMQQKTSKELDLLNALTETNVRLRDRERSLTDMLIKKTEVLNHLKTPKGLLAPTQWEDIKEAIDWLHDNFTKRLKTQYPMLTEDDIQVACFIKLRISISCMSTLLNISSDAVSKRKLRLKERLLLSKKFSKENKSLDLWLLDF